MITQSIRKALDDPCISYWLKDALLLSIEERDPLDALYDAQALAALLQERVNLMLYGHLPWTERPKR